ncbi:MAG TPA: type IV pilus twitching motility protein PilT [Acidimicrobiales bacterium]|jgi:twitching motility protein PilT|nr:type IV pilus twitching motility protein PilT [Acidimicrobiales bacterium]
MECTVLDFPALLRFTVDQGASDLHMRVGAPPRVRVDGELRLTPFPAVESDEAEALLARVMPADRRAEFLATGEADFSVSEAGLGRFRANAFRQRGSIGLVLRRVVPAARTVAEMGLPAVVTRLSDEARGMVLVTGPTGSGKTTTLAAMIDHINRTRAVHIITIEDPIEVTHPDKKAIISQREIGNDTTNFAQAMRRALRQDPDVILIGEMRDAETVSAALSAAETGHLVLSTLHTTNAEETINRVVDFFPPHQQHQVRLTLASVLRGVISQRLVPRADGEGRVASIEAMVATGRIADRIIDPGGGQGETITELIAEGEYHGMQTFDQSLFSLYQQGQITLRAALSSASNAHDLRVALQGAGLLATA